MCKILQILKIFYTKFPIKNAIVPMKNGLLYIDLERQLPESMKPRKVVINGAKTLSAE